MSDVDDKNLTDIITLRGKKISRFDEINEVANQAKAYILITVRLDEEDDDGEPIYVNQKISLENFLHVLLGDDSDNMIERFNRFFNDSTISLSSYMTNNDETNPISYLEKTDGKFHLHLETLNAEYVLNPETREKLFSDGIIDQDVLQRYVNDTVDEVTNEINTRIDSEISNVMRYINLDEDDVIDTLQEIINWFDNWRRNDDNLTSLIETIETYGESYTNQKIQELRNELSASINSMNVSTVGGDGQIITSVSQNSGKISATSVPVSSLEINVNQIDGLDDALSQIQNLDEGTNIEIDENNHINCKIGIGPNNSFTLSGTTFTLTMDADGKLNFSGYTRISVSSYSPSDKITSVEIDSTASESDRTMKVNANKAITTATWQNVSGGNIDNDSTSLTNSNKTAQIIVEQSGNTTIKRKCTISDGQNSTTSSEITLQFTLKRYFLGWSSSDNLQFTQCTSGTNINGTSGYNSFASALSLTTLCGVAHTGNGYWYLIVPQTIDVETIYFGSGSSLAPAPGGWVDLNKTVRQYSGSGVTYHVYRSKNEFSVPMNIQF